VILQGAPLLWGSDSTENFQFAKKKYAPNGALEISLLGGSENPSVTVKSTICALKTVKVC
jgi:hypothetical protein